MAYLLPNLSSTLLLLHWKSDKSSCIPQQQTSSSSGLCFPKTSLSISTHLLPPVRVAQIDQSPSSAAAAAVSTLDDKENRHKDDFYVNLGLAVRTLREDLPLIFVKDLNYDIYRDDVTFVDPLNTFTGIEKYKLIFWALRFHGRILFREIGLDVLRVWQPSENIILIRWNLRGIPRVPWEAKGEFQGTSRYKLDRNGKIYEHKVDNLAFNFPKTLKPSASSVLDLVGVCPLSPNPNPTFFSSSWIELYRAVKESVVDHQSYLSLSLVMHGHLATCS